MPTAIDPHSPFLRVRRKGLGLSHVYGVHHVTAIEGIALRETHSDGERSPFQAPLVHGI
jgi:hypothetical protein